ncbi:hypothetical protein ACFPT7_04140 [Acidicapsa dinghuensis]|uniref:Uncharacterized protein n=1 Tax=Acidicapsa dinghuensis TaxID=2218256 RepID=A0ABW1EB09_9BACT|nr:hypothetical protein [Acidicapsa dinghuensis]
MKRWLQFVPLFLAALLAANPALAELACALQATSGCSRHAACCSMTMQEHANNTPGDSAAVEAPGFDNAAPAAPMDEQCAKACASALCSPRPFQSSASSITTAKLAPITDSAYQHENLLAVFGPDDIWPGAPPTPTISRHVLLRVFRI